MVWTTNVKKILSRTHVLTLQAGNPSNILIKHISFHNIATKHMVYKKVFIFLFINVWRYVKCHDQATSTQVYSITFKDYECVWYCGSCCGCGLKKKLFYKKYF